MRNEFIDTIRKKSGRYYIRQLKDCVVVYRKDGFKVYFSNKSKARNYLRNLE